MKHAKQAYQLASVIGYLSVSEMINLVEDGNISGIPGITRVDIKRAYEINGEPVAYMCEKNDQEELLRVHFSKELKATEKELGTADRETVGIIWDYWRSLRMSVN